MVSRPVLCKAYIGRSPELEHLAARRRAAGDAHGGLVLVGGEPGIGKSRLLAEFLAPLMHGTSRIARVECREFAQDPFGPIDELLAGLDRVRHIGRTYESASERLAAVLDAFERHSARRTTVAIIEDIHWADPELIAILQMIAVRAAHQRLLVIATFRDNEIVPTHPNFVVLGKLLRESSVSMLSLTALDHDAMHLLLGTALEGQPALSTLALEDVARRSDGNPLFAEELLRSAVDRHIAGKSARADAVPITLHAVVRERLQRCSAAERELLAAASLCGRRFDLDLLDRVSGGAGNTELRNLLALQLIVPIEGKPREFAFRHSLTRDALYSELLPSEAKPLHEKIALALIASSNPDEHAIEIAYHYWQSGQREIAAPHFEAAAHRARSTLAYAEAVRWYERAADSFSAERDVARVRLELARTYAAADQPAHALEIYQGIVLAAERRNDLVFIVRTRKLMGGLLANDGRRDEAIAMLEETLAVVEGSLDRSARLELILRITNYHSLKQAISDAWTSLARVDVGALDPDSNVTAEYYLLSAQLHAREGRPARWREDFAKALAIFERSPSAGSFVRFSHVIFAWQAWATGELGLSEIHLQRALDASAESASLNNDVPLGMALGEFHAGNFESARRWLGRTRPAPALMSRKLRAGIGVELGVALADHDLIDEFLDLTIVDETVRVNDTYGTVRLCCSFGAGLMALERRREANVLFERASAAIDSTYEFIPAILTLAAFRPELVAHARVLLARDAATESNRFARAALALIDGESAARELRSDGHANALEADRAFTELGWAIFAARAKEMSDPAAALGDYQRMGHVAAVRRLSHVASSGERPVAAPSVLTAREREVARFVAEGRGNRETALAMGVSEKTIEKHLSSIYLKLSFHSRSELIAYVVAAGGATA